jgi:hypothetical protein
MRAIRSRLLGAPPKITPIGAKPKPPLHHKPVEPVYDEKNWGMTDNEWRTEADKLWVKTRKDGNEHLKLFNDTTKEFTGTKNAVKYSQPKHPFSSLHTHPNWDAPLSPVDMTGFLASKNERFVAAASNNHIFMIRKKPGYTPMYYQDQADVFTKAFDAERRRLIQLHFRGVKGGVPDQTAIGIKAGEFMCKKHGLEYKVITRKP